MTISTSSLLDKRKGAVLAFVVLCAIGFLPHCMGQPTNAPIEKTLIPRIPPTATPTVSAAPSITARPTSPTTKPTTTKPTTTKPVTDAPVTAKPTRRPSLAPVVPVVTSEPSDRPSDSPSDSPTAGPSDRPVTSKPSLNPTLRPTTVRPVTRRPTGAPVVEATSAPTPGPTFTRTFAPTRQATPVIANVTGVTQLYPGVTNLANDTQIFLLLQETSKWFVYSYNNFSTTNRTGGRRLQIVPSETAYNMATELSYVTQRVSSSGLLLTYDQNMEYMEYGTNTTDPNFIVSLPYTYAPTRDILQGLIGGTVPGFAGVGLIGPPVIVSTLTPTMAPSPVPGKKGGLGTGAIAGIVVAGVVGIPLLAYGGYTAYRAMKDRGSGSTGYVSAGSAPPSQLQVGSGGETISMMDDPTKVDTGSLADYQDQSVATVDYDYSKAYGGAGDNSVVSSVGGTLGDNTQQTAGEMAGVGAVGVGAAALASSYDQEDDANVREEVMDIIAPAGKLGVVIDTPDDGAPVVHAVKDSSVIADQIRVGDKLVAVDDEDVRSMTAIKVSKLISKKSANPSRKLTIVRTTFLDDSEG